MCVLEQGGGGLVKTFTHPLYNLKNCVFLQIRTAMGESNQSGETCRVIMSIPLDILPAILGKEGRKISQIRTLSRAKVGVIKQMGEARVTIEGPPQGALLAQQLISNSWSHALQARTMQPRVVVPSYTEEHAIVDILTVFSTIQQRKVSSSNNQTFPALGDKQPQ